MKTQGKTKTALAALVGASRAELEALLDPSNDDMTLATLKRAATALGMTLRVELT